MAGVSVWFPALITPEIKWNKWAQGIVVKEPQISGSDEREAKWLIPRLQNYVEFGPI